MGKTNELMLDGAPSFVITSMIAKQHRGLGMDTGEVIVTIIVPNDLFKLLKKKGNFGSVESCFDDGFPTLFIHLDFNIK